MSFQLWVIRAADLAWSSEEGTRLLYAAFADEDARQAALAQWQDESARRHLYSAPFGADGTVYTFWSRLAGNLGLPLLTSLYEEGLVLETAGQLDALQQELALLEAYWARHPGALQAAPDWGIYGQEREHLSARMGYVREAIRIAKEHGAILGIT